MKQIVPQEDDKSCQVNNEAVCADKKCQGTMYYKKVDKHCQITNMWPVKPINAPEPEMLQSSNKQHMYEECPVKSTAYSDMNCQDNKGVYMPPVQPEMNMQSMPRPLKLQSKYKKMQLPKPAVPY